MPGKLKLSAIGMYTTDRFMRVIPLRAAERIALELRAKDPLAQGGGAADKKAGRRGNAIPP